MRQRLNSLLIIAIVGAVYFVVNSDQQKTDITGHYFFDTNVFSVDKVYANDSINVVLNIAHLKCAMPQYEGVLINKKNAFVGKLKSSDENDDLELEIKVQLKDSTATITSVDVKEGDLGMYCTIDGNYIKG